MYEGNIIKSNTGEYGWFSIKYTYYYSSNRHNYNNVLNTIKSIKENNWEILQRIEHITNNNEGEIVFYCYRPIVNKDISETLPTEFS